MLVKQARRDALRGPVHADQEPCAMAIPPEPIPAAGQAVRQARPLGAGYRRLWAASTLSGLGDGVRLVALPLLAASFSRDPRVVSTILVASCLPWLAAPVGGALVDRLDRRQVMWTVDLFRAGVLAAFAVAVLAGAANIPLIAALALLLGAAQILFDSAADAILPGVVPAAALERANGRLAAGRLASQEFVGPPVGGALFAALAAAPFLLDAATFALACGLVAGVRGRFRAAPVATGPRGLRSFLSEVAEGLGWLWRHRLLRGLCCMHTTWNFVDSAVYGVLVLYAQDVLDLDARGYGLVVATAASGGLFGSLLTGRLVDRTGPGPAGVGAVMVAAACATMLTLTTSILLAGLAFALFGAAEAVWYVVTSSLRQSLVPAHLRGRVMSSYRLATFGVVPAGAALGGLLASVHGLRAPFLLEAVAMLLIAIAGLRLLTNDRVLAARSA
jgi:MFS family permease